MSAVRFSDGARLSGILAAILLLTSLPGADCADCPKHCSCVFNKYSCYNGTISLQALDKEMRIGCKGTEFIFDCTDMPRLDLQFHSIDVYACPTSIVKCLGDPLGFNQLHVLYLNAMRLPDNLEEEYVRDLKHLNGLRMSFDDVTTIPFAAINSLKNLNLLTVDGGKMQLRSNSRFNSSSMKKLFIINSDIDNTQTGLFKGLPNLKYLNINTSAIGNISAGFFKGLDSLEYLLLVTNNIKSIDVGVFLSTPKLRILYINNNSLESLTDYLREGLPSLEELFIVCPHDEYNNGSKVKLDSRVFSRLPALKLIKIMNCVLQKPPVHSLNIYDDLETVESAAESQANNYSSMIFSNLASLSSLELSSNSIYELPKVMFTNVTAIKKLLLNDNKIKGLHQNVFGNLSILNSLDLSHNYIKVLHDGVFSNLTALKILKLDHNAIEIVTINLLKGLQSLSELYLQNNNIQSIDATLYPTADAMTPFKYLTNVSSINLSYNKINRMYDSTIEMPNLKALNLTNNCFKDMWDFRTFINRANMTLDLSHNEISHIQQHPGTNRNLNKTGLNGGRLYLIGNPIICDCTSYGLFLRSTGIGENDDPMYILADTKCIGPPHLKGNFIKELSPTDLVCDLVYNCPNNCNCIYQPATDEIIMNCEKNPSYLPNYSMDDIFIYNYTLNLKTDPGSLMNLNINNLNISHTNLIDIKFKPNAYLKLLDVSKNNLTSIPEAILKTNIILYVSENPLQCECALVKELKEYRVGDYKLVRCADGTELSTIDVGRLCAWRMILTGYIVMAIIASIFLTKLSVSVYRDTKRRRMSIARVLFRRGSEYSIQMETRMDMTKEYDLFISFAHEDTQFVREDLLPNLENKYGQKVCIHDRDWIAGELIEDQICQSVESARRTIIILTEAFILSEWSYLEFRTAHNLSIREGRPRVIIILLNKEIVNDVRLSKAIKSYTLVNTYLVWGDPEFWKKLKRILPRRGHR